LAEFCSKKIPGSEVRYFDPVLIEELNSAPNYKCLYGIVSKKNKDRLLRVALTWEEAEFLTRDDSVLIKSVLLKL